MNKLKPRITWYPTPMVSMKAITTKFFPKTDIDKINEKKYLSVESDMIF